jgi:hypothetical protein
MLEKAVEAPYVTLEQFGNNFSHGTLAGLRDLALDFTAWEESWHGPLLQFPNLESLTIILLARS